MDTHISKKDCRGRIWRSAEVWRKLVEEFYEDGGSVASLCEERNIHPGTFYSWLSKERKHEVAPAFLEVQMATPAVKSTGNMYPSSEPGIYYAPHAYECAGLNGSSD